MITTIFYQFSVSKTQVTVARRQVKIARHPVDVARHQVKIARHPVDVARRQVKIARHPVDVAHRQVDVARWRNAVTIVRRKSTFARKVISLKEASTKSLICSAICSICSLAF